MLAVVWYLTIAQQAYCAGRQGRSDGGYIGIYTPKNQSTLNFLCGCFVSLQWLVNIYTHPNQIPGYASALVVAFSRRVLTDGTKSIDCQFEDNGALPACGYKTAPDSKLNWTLSSHGELSMSRRSSACSFLKLWKYVDPVPTYYAAVRPWYTFLNYLNTSTHTVYL